MNHMPEAATGGSFEPVIKWPGSKRKIARRLAGLFLGADRYYEPFVGGGAMLPFRGCPQAIAGDIIPELIALWLAIRDRPETTASEYEERWTHLQERGHTAYYAVRDSFNATRSPHDLLFLTRTCVNGLVRFNRKLEFNNSLHHTRPGISPARMRKVIQRWSGVVQGVDFVAAHYRETLATVTAKDIVFLDPPYAGTKGRYMPYKLELEQLYQELARLNTLGARWVLTLDGRAGERAYQASVPPDLYRVGFGLPTGNSPFSQVMGKRSEAVVESVYLNFEPTRHLVGQPLPISPR